MLAEQLWTPGLRLSERFRLAAPFVLCGVVALAIWSPVLVRNLRGTGKPFPTSFDGVQANEQDSVKDTPVLDRRSLGYLWPISFETFSRPFFPGGTSTEPGFFPVLLAGTFGDYMVYGYAPRRPQQPGDLIANQNPVRREAMKSSRLSVIGGTAIALAAFCCWLACLRALWLRREVLRLPLLLAPPLAIAGLLQFTTPTRSTSKGSSNRRTCSLVPPPSTHSSVWRWSPWARRWGGRLLALAPLAGLGLVAFYTFFCLTLPLAPRVSRLGASAAPVVSAGRQRFLGLASGSSGGAPGRCSSDSPGRSIDFFCTRPRSRTPTGFRRGRRCPGRR